MTTAPSINAPDAQQWPVEHFREQLGGLTLTVEQPWPGAGFRWRLRSAGGGGLPAYDRQSEGSFYSEDGENDGRVAVLRAVANAKDWLGEVGKP